MHTKLNKVIMKHFFQLREYALGNILHLFQRYFLFFLGLLISSSMHSQNDSIAIIKLLEKEGLLGVWAIKRPMRIVGWNDPTVAYWYPLRMVEPSMSQQRPLLTHRPA